MLKKIILACGIFISLPILTSQAKFSSLIVNESGYDDIHLKIETDNPVNSRELYYLKEDSEVAIPDKIKVLRVGRYKKNGYMQQIHERGLRLKPEDKEAIAKGESYIAIQKGSENEQGITFKIVPGKPSLIKPSKSSEREQKEGANVATLDQCKAELNKARNRITYLEAENQRLQSEYESVLQLLGK